MTSQERAVERAVSLARAALNTLDHEGSVIGSYVSGSIMAGVGNAASDVDLYVVESDVHAFQTRQILVDGVRVDVEFLQLEELETAISSLDEYRDTFLLRPQAQGLDSRRQDLLARFLIGRDLTGMDRLEALRNSLHVDVLRKVTLGQRAATFVNAMEDAYGAVHDSDLATALDVTDWMMRKAVEAVLACMGDFYASSKFLLRRIGNVKVLAHLADHVAELLYQGADLSQKQVAIQLIRRRLWASTYLLGFALIRCWDGPPSVVPSIPQPDVRGPRRSTFSALLRFSDGYFLWTPAQGFKGDEILAILWTLCDGRPIPELIAGLARWHSAAPTQAAAGETTIASLARMRELGILVRDGVEDEFAGVVEQEDS